MAKRKATSIPPVAPDLPLTDRIAWAHRQLQANYTPIRLSYPVEIWVPRGTLLSELGGRPTLIRAAAPLAIRLSREARVNPGQSTDFRADFIRLDAVFNQTELTVTLKDAMSHRNPWPVAPVATWLGPTTTLPRP